MEPIAQYQQAVAALKSAIAGAERVVRVVTGGASALRDWRKTMVSNSSGGFPMEVALSRQSPSINASDWPSGQQIADALQQYHQAVTTLRNSYSAIPESQRGVVQAPDTFV